MTKAEREHLDAVAELGCIICHRPATIHHMRTGMGMGQKNDNFHVIPLCPDHHQHGGYGVAYHAGSRIWEANFGTEEELHERTNDALQARERQPSDTS